MTNEELFNWRSKLGWSRAVAAKKLGISTAALQIYERGARFENNAPVAVPKLVALACQHLSTEEL